MSNNFKMLATTLFGFEPLLERELLKLGAMDIKPGIRNVSFVGDLGFMYKANLSLRTAMSILKPVHRFKFHTEDEFYEQMLKFNWLDLMDVDKSFMISATIHQSIFSNSLFVAQRSKDAVVDHFRNKIGKRPNVSTDEPQMIFNVHINKNTCTLSIDSSGDKLFKRGYRTATNIAPINEVLAAGLLLHSGWDGQSDFMDPMCGSGTILIEAAMIACQIPPNLNRKSFGFMHWQDWDEDLYEVIMNSVLKKIRPFHFKIKGIDKAPSAVRKAQDNVDKANLSEFITIHHDDFFSTSKEDDRALFMLFNPPYGNRLDVNTELFYKTLGQVLKGNYKNTKVSFITTDDDAPKFLELKGSKPIKVFNGGIEAKLYQFMVH
ncbi:THUMP domain-containing class I SAM-dependent RNA methyltransferase [Flavobacteriaceae bacterium 14752]|uniref:THUMP domain-containing class I SAM-dependent RNA methyltransferase n=1 Tax=Mesohalobacter salilacus TaxID=2491711 RepID=UPI000F62E3F5|nr:class I SAM-dependent RNA methyltransferase [Flavobacteriaceae bacterium 14752]